MKNKIIISLVILIFILMIATSVNAAIEIKPGTTTHTNISANNSFQYCYNMRNPTSSLGNNTLDPHLTLNKDWGAVAYLGLSGYGSVSSDKGSTTTIDGTSYTTTTGNPTGVLNFGKNHTQTSSLIQGYKEGTWGIYFGNLINNLNTGYTETITSTNTRGLATSETKGWCSSSELDTLVADRPINIRTNILSYGRGGYNSGYGSAAGNAYADTTYRPVLWN